MSDDILGDKNKWRVLLLVCAVGAVYFLGVLALFSAKFIDGVPGVGVVTEIYLSNDGGDIISIMDPRGNVVKESMLLFPNFSFSPFQKNKQVAMICDSGGCLVNHPYVWLMEIALLLLFLGGIFYCLKKSKADHNEFYRKSAKILFSASAFSVAVSLLSLF